MAKNQPEPDTTQPDPEPEPPTVDYVIGSNKGHAERHMSRTRKYPRARAIPIDAATPQLLEGKTVAIARDPADRAALWDDLKTYGCTITD